MTSHPVKYAEHWSDGHRRLQVHRLDELVQITVSRGIDDPNPDVFFLGPTEGEQLGLAIEAAARHGRIVFEGGEPPLPVPPDPPARLRRDTPPAVMPPFGPAFNYGGLPATECPAGDGGVLLGDSARIESATGRVWHDDCAETTSPTSASAPPGWPAPPASSGGAHGAAGACRASAAPGQPAAPEHDLLTSASAPPGTLGSASGCADGAAAAGPSSAVAYRPAAPSPT